MTAAPAAAVSLEQAHANALHDALAHLEQSSEAFQASGRRNAARCLEFIEHGVACGTAGRAVSMFIEHLHWDAEPALVELFERYAACGCIALNEPSECHSSPEGVVRCLPLEAAVINGNAGFVRQALRLSANSQPVLTRDWRRFTSEPIVTLVDLVMARCERPRMRAPIQALLTQVSMERQIASSTLNRRIREAAEPHAVEPAAPAPSRHRRNGL